MRDDSPELKIASRRTAILATILILVGSAVLIFTHLGHYALWDDESLTALTARSVWRTGDTSAWVDDHNLLAYRNGLLIKGFADRYSPPLQFYLLAPFIGLLGQSTWICRLPFALCGLLTIALMLRWLWQLRPPALVWWVTTVVILTDVSFFLFNRQCRYYALACLFTVAIAYAYHRWIGAVPRSSLSMVPPAHGAGTPAHQANNQIEVQEYLHHGPEAPCHEEVGHQDGNRNRTSILPLTLALTGLLVSHYLNYAGVVGCLVIDYILWGRHRRRLVKWDWVVLILPQAIVGAIVWSIWNPAARSAVVAAAGRASSLGAAEYASTVVPFTSSLWWKDYALLLWWNCRDMLASEFVIIPLLLMCPLLYFSRKNSWLLRAPLAMFVFLAITALLTTHPITEAGDAEVRYLAPLLPLGIGIAILATWAIASMKRTIRFSALGLAAMTLFIAPAQQGIFGATPFRYYHELWQPQQEPYTPVAAWINHNIPPGASVYVQPAYMTYSLMFHAGKVLYAWQLPDPPKPEYAHVNVALIRDRVAPDYLIAFGPFTNSTDLVRAQLAARGIHYQKIDTIHVFWHDLFRPEKIWRSFETVPPQPGNEVYIYQQTFSAPLTTASNRD